MIDLTLAVSYLSSPIILCFCLGAAAAAVKSELSLPESVFTALSIYLMLAIGLKGGADLAAAPIREVALAIAAALVVSAVIPIWTFATLRAFGKLTVADAAALAAHYGSVSAVTFFAVLAFLESAGVVPEPYVATLLAVMEVPAILVALALAAHYGSTRKSLPNILAETLTNKSVVLLLGGLAIGYVAGPKGIAPVKPLFVDMFRGLLCLFMLELGRQTLLRAGDFRKVGSAVVTFALVAPLLNATLGLAAAWSVGLSTGSATILATLCASASYIVAPAAIRIALPQASPGIYLTASLAITFPFNLIVGIPIYYTTAIFAIE